MLLTDQIRGTISTTFVQPISIGSIRMLKWLRIGVLLALDGGPSLTKTKISKLGTIKNLPKDRTILLRAPEGG